MINRQAPSGLADREPINRARQAAEELFKPKRPAVDAERITAASGPSASSEQQPPRRPRIIAAQRPVQMSITKDEIPAEPKPERRNVTAGQRPLHMLVSQFGRVRALVKYGMTRTQVAELYGVGIDEIERIVSGPASRQDRGG